MENKVLAGLPFSQFHGKYFIAISISDSSTLVNRHFFEKIYAISGRNQVHLVVDQIGQEQHSKLIAQIRTFKNFHVYFLNKNQTSSDLSFENSNSAGLNLLRQKYLDGKSPYFLNIACDTSAPRGLLNKFERAISFLEKSDPDWGVIGGLYHRGISRENVNEFKNKTHVLWGYTVYKRSLLEKYSFEMIPLSSSNFPFAWSNLDRILEFNFYEGHALEFFGYDGSKIKPVIVKL